MRAYSITIECKESGECVSATREELERAPLALGPHEVCIDRGVVVCDGRRMADAQWIEGESGKSFRLTAKEIFKRAEEVTPRLRRKYCMNCTHWDRPYGVRLYETQTHSYANGSFSRIEEIIKAVSAHNKLSPLTPTNVGYCPLFVKLCGEASPACAEHYNAKPWLARLRNWWIRMFR